LIHPGRCRAIRPGEPETTFASNALGDIGDLRIRGRFMVYGFDSETKLGSHFMRASTPVA
jgi:hypothetical protein